MMQQEWAGVQQLKLVPGSLSCFAFWRLVSSLSEIAAVVPEDSTDLCNEISHVMFNLRDFYKSLS